MGRRGKKRKRRRKGPNPKPVPPLEPVHPMGTYGLDWDDTFAFIAGFTSAGFAYGTTWEEATWLRDDPAIQEFLGPEECARLWDEPRKEWVPTEPQRDRSDGDDEIPF